MYRSVRVLLTVRTFPYKGERKNCWSNCCEHASTLPSNTKQSHCLSVEHRNDYETSKIISGIRCVSSIVFKIRATIYCDSALHCLQFSIRSLNSSICNVISKNLYLSWIFRVAVHKMFWGLVPGSANKNIMLSCL